MNLRIAALTCIAILSLSLGCNKDDDSTDAPTQGSFTADVTGARVATWTGTATFRPPNNFVNNSARYTIVLQTGGETDPEIIINVLIDADGRPETAPTGTYSTGQFGPGTSVAGGGFAEFYLFNDREFTYVDNPGEVVITRSDENVVAGTFDVFIYGTTGTGNPGIFRGSFTAVPDR